jgi:hypothetical protein
VPEIASFGGVSMMFQNVSLLYIVLPSAVILTIAYFTYGRILSRLFQLNPDRPTPAVEQKDGLDFDPLAPSSLVPQHFSPSSAPFSPASRSVGCRRSSGFWSARFSSAASMILLRSSPPSGTRPARSPRSSATT